MELFLKTAAGAVVALVLILTLGKQEKDIALLLGLLACCMTAAAALKLFRPVMDFLYRLEALAELQENGLPLLLKAVGIGMVSELVAALCQDGGNASLGKQVQLLAGVLILNLSLPFLEHFLELVETLLGDL